MDLNDIAARLSRLDPRLARAAETILRRVPAARARLDREYDRMLAGLEAELRPYRDRAASYARLPDEGVPRAGVLEEIRDLAGAEEHRWKDGFASGAVYQGDDAHVAFLNEVYGITSQVNPLHADLWPSASKYEAEVVSMTAGLLGADADPGLRDPAHGVVGTVTSGGTESILLSMKAYRDSAKSSRKIARAEIVAPTTAHVAFDKAAQYFGMKMIRVPVGPDYRADVGATHRAMSRNTAVVVGSAPTFPHGVIDPIEELAGLAKARGVGFHTDACLGGFVLPFARALGERIPPFDFTVDGVTSMSADTHKFGYAAKGTSVVLYRGTELRSHQYFTATEWPGGLYFSPTIAGSRPGALSAACWAAMVATGRDGYLDATRRILDTGRKIRTAVESIPELHVLGDPMWIVAFGSEEVDVYRVLDRMTARGWSLNGLHKPPAVHLCVTLRHTQPGIAERFADDLRDSVDEVRSSPPSKEGMAPVYGLAATVPFRGMVGDLLKKYLDLLYRP